MLHSTAEASRGPFRDKQHSVKAYEIPQDYMDQYRPAQSGSYVNRAFEDFRSLNIRKSRLELTTQAEFERKRAEAEYRGASYSPIRKRYTHGKSGSPRVNMPLLKRRDAF
jgi:hypothetical protein